MRCLAILLAVQIGCVAPQRSGAERITFLTLQTSSAAFLGALAGVVTCNFGIHGLGHARNTTKKQDRIVSACAIGGVVLAGGAALYGGAITEKPPERVNWIVVSLAPAVYTIAGIWWIVNRLTNNN